MDGHLGNLIECKEVYGHSLQHEEPQKKTYDIKGEKLLVTEEERYIGVRVSDNLKPTA
jgi:hypothetical protein